MAFGSLFSNETPEFLSRANIDKLYPQDKA
jgi:hypothetical protein